VVEALPQHHIRRWAFYDGKVSSVQENGGTIGFPAASSRRHTIITGNASGPDHRPVITGTVYCEDKQVAIAGEFQLCLVDVGASNRHLPIGDPYCCKYWDLMEPYAKVPTGGTGRGGGVSGLTEGTWCCWLELEETEGELAISRDELVADSEHFADRQGFICDRSRAWRSVVLQGGEEEEQE
jgi:hypothetical protein